MSSVSTWDGPQLFVDEEYPPELLKYLLREMMIQFSAQGACIALLDESNTRMRVRLHVRLRPASRANPVPIGARPRRTVALDIDDTETSIPTSPFTTSPSTLGPGGDALRTGMTGPHQAVNGAYTNGQGSHSIPPRPRLVQSDSQSLPALPPLRPPDELEEVPRQQSELFAVGTLYRPNEDMIGLAWAKNESHIFRHEEYLNYFNDRRPLLLHTDVTPTSYFVIPIQETTLVDDMRGRRRRPQMLGVVVLYQTVPAVVNPFQASQRTEAMRYAERIALYLQNDRLQRAQRRTSLYLNRIQEISNIFPANVKLSELLHTMHTFAAHVVHVSSILITLYDRDTDKIYDVYVTTGDEGSRNAIEYPVVTTPQQRPAWWQATQRERHTLCFSPTRDEEQAQMYEELLLGTWGDQRDSGSFLLLPMKMFNRIVGSLAIVSPRPAAYREEEIQVLETMVQIVTVSLENVKLYERDKALLHEGKQREAHLAALNSAFQSISSGLNMEQLLNSLVDSAAQLMDVELSVYFQTTPDKTSLVARAMYSPPSHNDYDDGSDMPSIMQLDRTMHNDLISEIQLPYKGTILEQSAQETYFYLDTASIEDLAQRSEVGGRIFLEELKLRQVLLVPVAHDTDLLGFLAISALDEMRRFRPKDVGVLLAVCAQAAGAIRHAQLFMELEEAYAEQQRLSTLKDEFLVTASHELRTPLAAINGYASLLKRQSARISPENILRYAVKIGGAAQQLSDLMTSMTEASKIGTVDRKLDLKMELVQLRRAVEIAVGMLSVNVEQEMTFETAADLWVHGDPLRVRQVMTNLLDNAAKYSPPAGKIHLEVTKTTLSEVEKLLPEEQKNHPDEQEASRAVALVRVIDQGEGIAPEDQRNIFEKFVRAPRSLTTPVRGTGLGLYISRRYIEAMRGHLWLERSVVNEGSVFSFYLPLLSPDQIPATPYEIDESQFTNSLPRV